MITPSAAVFPQQNSGKEIQLFAHVQTLQRLLLYAFNGGFDEKTQNPVRTRYAAYYLNMQTMTR